MKNPTVSLSFILIFVWIYTGLDKLLRWEASWKAFHNQTFPADLAAMLSYAVPISEILIALLLLFSVSRWWGFLSSILLLTIFNTYVGLIWVGAFPRIPCNCAGIIESLDWAAHFWLNNLLILISILGLWLNQKNRNLKVPV